MQWTLRGAHLLLQTRTRVLNEDLDDLFRRWVPKIQVTTTNEGAGAQGGLTPDFLALSNIIKAFRPSHRHTVRGMLGNPMPGNGYPT
jgi:hypothetical protein